MNIPKYILSHPVELILIISSAFITGTSYYLYFQDNNSQLNEQILGAYVNNNSSTNKEGSYFIDVSGAVIEPDLYEVTPGARLKEVIDLAGGLSEDADSFYVGRNFNMAKILVDQEKVYIPYVSDIANGTIVEESKALNYLLQKSETSEETTENNSTYAVSINNASLEELDTLPGIGPVSAQKIADNRPYTNIDELLEKKVVSNSTFSKIKDLIQL